MSTATAPTPIYECPKHPGEQLSRVLKGGAGYCARCRAYVQSANHPMPELSPEIAAKRAASKPKTRAKAKPKTRGTKEYETTS
jgi:hypothetical protein